MRRKWLRQLQQATSRYVLEVVAVAYGHIESAFLCVGVQLMSGIVEED